jgi:hypothetical protein
MGQHEQDDLTTGMTLQMVQLNTLGQLERGHLERGVLNVAPTVQVYCSSVYVSVSERRQIG